jgi:hypothetical protein
VSSNLGRIEGVKERKGRTSPFVIKDRHAGKVNYRRKEALSPFSSSID